MTMPSGNRVLNLALAAGLAALLTTMLTVQVASGEPPTEQRERRVVVALAKLGPTSTAGQEDLAAVAIDLGLSLTEARTRFSWQNDFTTAVDKIRKRYPNSFAGARMSAGSGVRAHVEFSGRIPSDISGMLEGLSVDVELLGGARRTEEEKHALIRAAHYAAQGSTTNVVGTELVDDDTILVTLHGNADARAGTRAEQAAEQAISGQKVSVKAAAADPLVASGSQLTVFGGGALDDCTTGFTVRRTSGTEKGIITAEHCPDSQNYRGSNVLRYVSRITANSGDIQYMRITGATAGRQFYNDVNRLSNQDRLNTPTQGMAICKFGKVTGKDCTKVRDTFTCRAQYCNLVSTDKYVTAGGDSGGPWSYGTTVYGVHSGYHTSGLAKRSQFTPVYNTLGELGVAIYY